MNELTNTKLLEIHLCKGATSIWENPFLRPYSGDSVFVIVDAGTDLEQPFTGECMDTGEQRHFRQPWALDIEVVGNGISAVL